MKIQFHEWYMIISSTLVGIGAIRFLIWEHALFKREKQRREEEKRQNASKPS